MDKLQESVISPNELSPLPLAFVGDTVFDLLVRQYLVNKGNCPVKKLHGNAVKIVNAASQSRYLNEILLPELSEKETEVCLRGRNAKVKHVPKNAEPSDYHSATALECLFGYLYLSGNHDRINELFGLILQEISGEI